MGLTTWDLHKEPEAGNDQLLEVVCDVQPADLMAFMSRLMAGKRDDDAAEVSGYIVIQLFWYLITVKVCLNIERVLPVPIGQLRDLGRQQSSDTSRHECRLVGDQVHHDTRCPYGTGQRPHHWKFRVETR